MTDDLAATMAEHDRRLTKVEERQERQRAEVDRLVALVRDLAAKAGVHIGGRPGRAAPS